MKAGTVKVFGGVIVLSLGLGLLVSRAAHGARPAESSESLDIASPDTAQPEPSTRVIVDETTVQPPLGAVAVPVSRIETEATAATMPERSGAKTIRVSVASDGTEANGASLFWAVVSADGRYVAFDSYASNLVPDDTNETLDVFVHDLHSGETTRVSVNSEGVEGNRFSSNAIAMSADGRYVAFNSGARNLVDGDTNGFEDVFVHDRETGQTSLVSVASDGTQGNATSGYSRVSMSADGRYVAWHSGATNLVPDDTNDAGDVFVHDRQTSQTERVSVSSDGEQGNDSSGMASLSADGRYVAFQSSASNLVSGDTNGTWDVFVRDRATGKTSRVSVSSSGDEANGGSGSPWISADGRYVAFRSDATNLVEGDTNGVSDIFVHDRHMGETTRVSVSTHGEQGNQASGGPSISADGRYVAFYSEASNLVSDDTNGVIDVFVHNRETGVTERLSVSTDGSQGDGSSSHWRGPTISADGRYVAFNSAATNLVSDDTNGLRDTFVRDRGSIEATDTVSGRLAVSAPPFPMAYEPLPGTAWVRNTGSYDSQFTVLIELQQDGQPIESHTAALTVPAGALHTHPFQLDPQDDGHYQLLASLSVDGDVVSTATQQLEVVLSPDRRTALLAAEQLEAAAMREFDRARGIVFEAYVESILQIPEDAAKAILDSLHPVGDAMGFAESQLLATKVGAWLAGLDDLVDTHARPAVEEWVREHPLRALDDALTQERQQVSTQTDQFNAWVRSSHVVWQGGILTNEYIRALGTRVEDEKMWGVGPPPLPLGRVSLSQQQLTFLVYEGLGVGLDWLVIVGAVAVLFLLFFATGPVGVAFLGQLAALKGVGLQLLSLGTGVLLLLIAMVMHIQVVTGVAPAITNTHAAALDALQSSLSGGTLTEDQRPFATQTSQTSDRQQQTPSLSRQGDPSFEQGTALALTPSDLSLSLDIAQPQLALGETLEATIGITNTLVTTGTGEVALLVQSTDGENVAAWPVELESGGSDHLDFSFVPDAAGSYVLRASVLDSWGELLGFEEAGYVVGNGPALSINIDCEPIHSPGTDVTLSLRAANDGNEPASPLITLITLDEGTAAPIYTQTISIPLDPETEVISVATVLTDAVPGQYRINLALDGTPYHHPRFVVSAEDTLRAETWFDDPSPAPGETVTLGATIVDGGGSLADAAVHLEVLDPEGFPEPLTVTRVATGTYQATYSPILSGTHDVSLTADRLGWRGVQVADAFAVGQPSPLVPEITGTLQAGQVTTVTVSVTNGRNVPVPGAFVTLFGVDHQLHEVTDAAGNALLWVSPRSMDDYQVRIQKLGYARTTGSLSVIPYWADLTGDCVVDVADIQAVASRWRCARGDECYDPRYDVDGDGVITVTDIMKVAAEWGWSCP